MTAPLLSHIREPSMTLNYTSVSSSEGPFERLKVFVLNELRACKFNLEYEIDRRGTTNTVFVATSPTYNASVRFFGSGRKLQFGRH